MSKIKYYKKGRKPWMYPKKKTKKKKKEERKIAAL